jgi:hypoxanthine-DNA glycosylase
VHQSFPPVVDERTETLILGSMPGALSLERAQYYAHPRNQFWRLVGSLIEIDLPALPYPDRCQALLRNKVGLWDVFKSCTREGSLDAAIRDAEPNDLPGLAARLPRLRLIAFNGGTAAKSGQRVLNENRVPLAALPSSSPAYTLAFEEKRKRWAEALRAPAT